MEPMKPMTPMKPLDMGTHEYSVWWPKHLGRPSVTGSSNDLHYAYFDEKNRLAVDDGKDVKIYDTGGQSISGFTSNDGRTLTFKTKDGVRQLLSLKEV